MVNKITQTMSKQIATNQFTSPISYEILLKTQMALTEIANNVDRAKQLVVTWRTSSHELEKRESRRRTRREQKNERGKERGKESAPQANGHAAACMQSPSFATCYTLAYRHQNAMPLSVGSVRFETSVCSHRHLPLSSRARFSLSLSESVICERAFQINFFPIAFFWFAPACLRIST